MKTTIQTVLGFLFVLISLSVHANDSTAVALQILKERRTDSTVTVTIKATLAGNVKLYALQSPQNNQLYSSIVFDTALQAYVDGPVEEIGTKHSEKDVAVNATADYFSNSVLWKQQIKAKPTDSF